MRSDPGCIPDPAEIFTGATPTGKTGLGGGNGNSSGQHEWDEKERKLMLGADFVDVHGRTFPLAPRAVNRGLSGCATRRDATRRDANVAQVQSETLFIAVLAKNDTT